MDKHHFGNLQQLKEVQTNIFLTEELISQAIQKYNSDPLLYEEAIRQASKELSHVQSVLDQSMFT
ncbi:hypothetical protein [Oceanobacillus halophilus]|uniref:Uncharacterized protein n=1 Tax=Oceanobacillus halophilus TaxID=930130 RepID=A0A495A323_9BACI|nr:hypothetical protein [Oceanobacillus halophilus]RKQ33894.1 hypothetical protein D8M06_08700 [Oceanobacillus halophilus]